MNTSSSELNSTTRFSDRVAYYIKYRPGYPPEVIDFLRENLGLAPARDVADVGSGTGILSTLLLDVGATVYCVEPNREMREAAEELIDSKPGFVSIDGTAEATGLPDASVDLITAGQAFHWFDPVRTREEFARILRPGGHVALIWNERRIDSTPFMRAYQELLLTHGTDYAQVTHEHVTARDRGVLARFFSPNDYHAVTFDNVQRFDFEGLKGRLLSSSYVPMAGHPKHEGMLAAAREIFDRHQVDGHVMFEYETEVFHGRLD